MKDTGNSTRAPARLLATAPRGSALARGLDLARSRGPTEQQLRDLERGVLATVGVAGAASILTAAAQAARATAIAQPTAVPWFAAGATKVALGLALGTVTAGGAVVWHRSAETKAHHSAQTAAHRSAQTATHPTAARTIEPVTPPVPSPPVAAPPIAVAGVAPAQTAPPKRVAAVAVASRSIPTTASTAPPVAPPVATDSGQELRLLARAHRIAADEPAVALALADEHARRFPAGLMDQEREMIAVTALVKLGRIAEARQRAERFAREHAGSAYLERMRGILAQPALPR
jgi:hypothetical protein